MYNTTDIPVEIREMSIVVQTISAIRCMYDMSSDKPLYDKVHWLDGMDEEYSKALSMLFKSYGAGHESVKAFAKRLAGIK